MTTYNLGQAVTLSTSAFDADGDPATPTLVLTLTKPDGTTATPVVTAGSATFIVDQRDTWFWRWDATVAFVDNDRGQFTVADPQSPAYADLADLKSGMTIVTTDRDARLGRALRAASRSIDKACGRRFWLDQTPTARRFSPADRIVDTPDGQKFLIDDIGSTFGLEVAIGSGTSFTAFTDYDTGPDNALVKGDPITWLMRPCGIWWLARGQKVQVTAQWGYPWIPEDIAEATLLLANRLYKRKDSPEGVLGSAEWGPVRVSRTDPDVLAMIESYVLPGIG